MRSVCSLLLVWCLCTVALSAGGGAEVPGRTELAAQWRWAFTDDPAFASRGYDDRGWEPVVLPAHAGVDTSGGSQYMWLRAAFTVEPSRRGERLYVLAGKAEGALEYYVNGVLLYTHGSFPPEFFYHTSALKQFIIPPELLSSDEPNLLAVRVWRESGAFVMPAMFLGTQRDYHFNLYTLDFLSNYMNVLFASICLFIGMYFLLQYLGNREQLTNLFYALGNICFAVYFFDLGFPYKPLSIVLSEKIGKSLLMPAVGFLLLFFLDFFGKRRPVWSSRITGLVALFLGLSMLIIPENTDQIASLFNILLLPVVIAIGIMTTLAVRATIRRHPDAPVILVGMILAVGFSIHDVVYQVMGVMPLIWFQGVGMFCLNLSMFATLGIRSIRIDRSLKRFNREAADKSRRLETIIGRIREVTEETSSVSALLDEHIGTAVSLVNGISSQSELIAGNAEGQSRVVGETNETVIGLLTGVDGIFEGLEVQARHVEETSSAIEETLASISSISSDLDRTAEFAENLRTTMGEATRAVAASSEAMSTIESLSRTIHEVIEAVDDLAEKTNLLSINAAIEAANAGVSGRGFAVVAGEIKQLARASSDRVRQISDHVSAITASIAQGVEMNANLGSLLADINEKTASTVDRVQATHEAVRGQKQASEDILGSTATLTDASEKIRREAALQRDGGRDIRSRLDELAETSGKVRSSIREISRENTALAELIRNIGEFSSRSRASVSRLSGLLDDNPDEEPGHDEPHFQ